MFWKYFLFEAKLLLHNRKNWLLGIALMLFFPVFILYMNQSPQQSLRDIKKEEQEEIQALFEMYGDELQNGTPEQQEVYENLLQQSSLVNFQVFYIRKGDVTEDYIDNGLALTDLRLAFRELETQGIAEHLILSEEEILKEDALLQFLNEEQVSLDSNTFLAENQFVLALSAISGLPFVFYLLLSANDILVYEARHETVMKGFPISFMKKMNAKVILHFIHTNLFLAAGILLGGFAIFKVLGAKALNSPVLIYINHQYEAVTLFRYLLLVLLGMAIITFVIYYLSLLLNILFKNAYANIVAGLSLFLLPNVFMILSGTASFLAPLKFIEFTNVLSGALAKQLRDGQIDFIHTLLWLVALSGVLLAILYAKNKLAFGQLRSYEMGEYDVKTK